MDHENMAEQQSQLYNRCKINSLFAAAVPTSFQTSQVFVWVCRAFQPLPPTQKELPPSDWLWWNRCRMKTLKKGGPQDHKKHDRNQQKEKASSSHQIPG